MPVTLKEKIMLDECLPTPAEDEALLASAKNAGLKLADDVLKKHKKLYGDFPAFVETSSWFSRRPCQPV